MSLQDFFLKPSEEILKNKHHKDYPYNFFPEIKIEITPKQFILLDQKELSLLFKYESNGVFKFSFEKPIKKPFSFSVKNNSWNCTQDTLRSYTSNKVLSIDTSKDYYFFNKTNHKPIFIVYGFFKDNLSKPCDITKKYISSNYIKIIKKDKYNCRMLLYYRYFPEDA